MLFGVQGVFRRPLGHAGWYQALSCAQPQQLLQVTLNHSETLKKMVPSLAHVIDAVIEVGVSTRQLLATYCACYCTTNV